MADEQIKIEIIDGVQSSIYEKIDKIAVSAEKANTSVATLQKQLAALNGGGLNALNNALSKTVSATDLLSQAQDMLTNTVTREATAQARLQQILASTAISKQKLATETQKTALAEAKLTTEANQAAVAQQRLATESVKTATAEQNLAAAAARAQAAQQRLANTNKTLASSFVSVNDVMGTFMTYLLAFGTIAYATKGLADYSDSYTSLQNKLQNVTTSQAQVNYLTEEMFNLANRTRTDVDSTAQAFVRFDRALKIMGKSQSDSIRLTETVNKALINSGATTQEASAALLQLSQAFNSGRLQGDEFRSVSENMPIVLDAIAASTGKPISAIKKMSTEGQITAKVLYDAFVWMQDNVDKTFSKTVPTISQAFTVLSNNTKQYVGDLSKASGAGASFAGSIISLSQHLRELTVAAVTLGAALLVAFAPVIATRILSIAKSVLMFNAALAANPIGLLVVGLASAITYIALFGDEIKVTSDGLVTLKDVALSVWEYIKDGVTTVNSVMDSAWEATFGKIGDSLSDLGLNFESQFSFMFTVSKTQANFVIGSWVMAYRSITTVWDMFPSYMKNLGAQIVNYFAQAAEDVVKNWVLQLRGLAGLVESIAPQIGKSLTDALADVKLTLPRAQVTEQGKSIGTALAEGVKSAFGTDYIGNALTSLQNRAKEISDAREMGPHLPKTGDLRGTGPDVTGAQAAGKQKLTQAQKDYNAALKEFTKPMREYTAAMQVANDLYSSGKLNLAQYTSLVDKATESYQKATNPVYEFNKSAEEQFQILTKVGPAMDAERSLIQARNKAIKQGVPFTDQMAQSINDTTVALQNAKIQHETLNSLYDTTVGKQNTLTQQAIAYKAALDTGGLSLSAYNTKMVDIQTQMANLQLQAGNGTWTDVFNSSVGSVVSNFQNAMTSMASAFGEFFNGFVNGVANSFGQAIVYGKDLASTMADVARQILSNLIAALIKLGIQWAINAALGAAINGSALAATTAASVAAAGATAAAWAAPAALVSLASFGANSAPASAGILATQIVADSVALTSLAGFSTGGYTGDVGRNDIAGVVHGQEYVFDAASTNRIGTQTLDSLRNGTAQVNSNASNSSSTTQRGNVSVTIENYGTSKNFETEQLSEDQIRIIARDEATGVVHKEAPKVIATDLNNPNSRTSKSISRNTLSRRKHA